jgi:hypothetical protein
MRKSWKVLPLAAMATLGLQFVSVGTPSAQTTTGATTGILTGGLVGGTAGGTTGTTGVTTGRTTTGGGVPTPIVSQPRFTG